MSLLPTKRLKQRQPGASSLLPPHPSPPPKEEEEPCCWYVSGDTFRPFHFDNSEVAMVRFREWCEPILRTHACHLPPKLRSPRPQPDLGDDTYDRSRFIEDVIQAYQRMAVAVWRRLVVKVLVALGDGAAKQTADAMLPRMFELMRSQTDEQWQVKHESDTPQIRQLRQVAFQARAIIDQAIAKETTRQPLLTMSWSDVKTYLATAIGPLVGSVSPNYVSPEEEAQRTKDREFMQWYLDQLHLPAYNERLPFDEQVFHPPWFGPEMEVLNQENWKMEIDG